MSLTLLGLFWLPDDDDDDDEDDLDTFSPVALFLAWDPSSFLEEQGSSVSPVTSVVVDDDDDALLLSHSFISV